MIEGFGAGRQGGEGWHLQCTKSKPGLGQGETSGEPMLLPGAARNERSGLELRAVELLSKLCQQVSANY